MKQNISGNWFQKGILEDFLDLDTNVPPHRAVDLEPINDPVFKKASDYTI